MSEEQPGRWRVHVDRDKCQGHNRCYSLAPELFDVDDLGGSFERGDGLVPAEPRGQSPPSGGELPGVRHHHHRDRNRTLSSRHPPVTDWATDFDHTDPAWVADPYPIWEDLRGRCPVAHSDRYGGVWLPVRHQDIAAVAYDTEHFTSRSVVVSELRPGPEHTAGADRDGARRSRRTRRSTPWPGGCCCRRSPPNPSPPSNRSPADLCRELLDATSGRTEFDAAVEYAQHIPLRVIIGMLGFPQEDADIFRRFIHQVLEDVDMPPEERQAICRRTRSTPTWTPASRNTRPSHATTSPPSCSRPNSTARSWRPTTFGAP